MTGHFKWECANVLQGVGDPVSTGAAKAFALSAIESGIEISTRVTYESGSSDMEAPIKKIMEDKSCLVNFVFGLSQDMSALLLEAHKQKYAGEWIVSENIIASLDSIVTDMKNHLDEPSVHQLLQGACGLSFQASS